MFLVSSFKTKLLVFQVFENILSQFIDISFADESRMKSPAAATLRCCKPLNVSVKTKNS